MNIHAKEIVRQLEQELELLKRATDNGQTEIIKEKAIAIETYCKLLKGTSTQAIDSKQPSASVQVQPTIPQSHVTTSVSVEPPSPSAPKSNLLDF
ncbi:DUF5327 family protein [Bacillus sp. JCM 19034]|uniref:DUF5327 family protein n=1 Tax=Bacillus sp. JCM 19034 TaxID=1481928 RepID=UPI00078133EE|nr:DUF5327 family protein [Bacillus sp. JCM 19034]